MVGILRKGSLIPPSRGISGRWDLLLHPSDFGVKSKTGTQDDALFWDLPELLWRDKLFGEISNGSPDDMLGPFKYGQLARAVGRAAEALGIEFVPYHLRHSGPRNHEARILAELQECSATRSRRR